MPPKGSTSFPKPTPRSRAFVINGPTYSDGDPSQRCTKDNASLTPVYAEPYQAYLVKIATKWIDEEAGGAEPAINPWKNLHPPRITEWLHTVGTTTTQQSETRTYGFERNLLFATVNRGTEIRKQIDRWLYGHTSNKYFDSPFRFYPHWKWLLNYGSGQACSCDLCGSNPESRSRRSVSSIGSVTKPRVRIAVQRPLQSGPVDEEGTPDVYRSLLSILKSEGQLKRKIEERASLDWRAEKPLVNRFALNITQQPAFLPRQGETVLYLRPLPAYLVLRRDTASQQFKTYNTASNTYSASLPQWQAGVVTQVPAITPTIALLTTPPPSDSDLNSLSTTGYRVSPLPSPSSTHKLLAKQHTYVPLSLIRPFSLQAKILSGIAPISYHPSITNALTLSSTVSLIDKHTFSGTWPTARIHSRGVFIGYESYWRGDTVVLLPEKPSREPVREILRITDIVTTFYNLQASPGNNDIGNLTPSAAKSITITLHGPVYTSQPTRSLSAIPISPAEYTTPMLGYGSWFYLEQPGDIWSAPFTRVLSRLYEIEAVQAWLSPSSPPTPSSPFLASSSFLPVNHFPAPTHPTSPTESLDLSRASTLSARLHAASTDERIILAPSTASSAQNKSWLWADYRAAALDLPSLGGLDVGRWDTERETGVWRGVLGVLDGRASTVVSATARRETRLRSVEGSEMGVKRRFEEVDTSEDNDDDDDAVIEGLIRGEGLEHADTDADELGHTGNHDGDEGMRRKKLRTMEAVEVKVPVPVVQID
ncbi:MAG: hypothetical protein Q9184_005306 [Pyrenodesmia sp. 2 TL-2023]